LRTHIALDDLLADDCVTAEGIMRKRVVASCIAGLLAIVSCADDPGVPQSGHVPPHGGADASGGSHDGGASLGDASEGPSDAASPEDDALGGGHDEPDASDASSADSGGTPHDSGAHDSGAHDSGTHDSGVADSGAQDSGAVDSGPVDSGAVDSGGTSLQQICVDEVNRYRAMNGKPPYSRWTSAETCGDSEAKSDSATGTAHGAFGTCHEFGQCECPGWPGPLETMIKGCLKAMWDEGPGGGHYDIMNSDSYKQVACGFYTLPNGKIWSVQDYK
jgi:hypothetical protein